MEYWWVLCETTAHNTHQQNLSESNVNVLCLFLAVSLTNPPLLRSEPAQKKTSDEKGFPDPRKTCWKNHFFGYFFGGINMTWHDPKIMANIGVGWLDDTAMEIQKKPRSRKYLPYSNPINLRILLPETMASATQWQYSQVWPLRQPKAELKNTHGLHLRFMWSLPVEDGSPMWLSSHGINHC